MGQSLRLGRAQGVKARVGALVLAEASIRGAKLDLAGALSFGSFGRRGVRLDQRVVAI